MVAFGKLFKSGLFAEDSRNVKLGEVFDHMRQSNDHLLGIPSQKSDEGWRGFSCHPLARLVSISTF